MLNATETDVLRVFAAVHGQLHSGTAVIVYNDSGEIEAVACVKDGQERWRATLGELAFDYVLLLASNSLS